MIEPPIGPVSNVFLSNGSIWGDVQNPKFTLFPNTKFNYCVLDRSANELIDARSNSRVKLKSTEVEVLDLIFKNDNNTIETRSIFFILADRYEYISPDVTNFISNLNSALEAFDIELSKYNNYTYKLFIKDYNH